jgi:hypothetical protein
MAVNSAVALDFIVALLRNCRIDIALERSLQIGVPHVKLEV